MPYMVYFIHLIAAAILANGIPYLVAGVSGQSSHTPLAWLGDGGDSTPFVNLVWGWAHFLVAFALFASVGPLYIATPLDTVFVGAGMLLTGYLRTRAFRNEQV